MTTESAKQLAKAGYSAAYSNSRLLERDFRCCRELLGVVGHHANLPVSLLCRYDAAGPRIVPRAGLKNIKRRATRLADAVMSC